MTTTGREVDNDVPPCPRCDQGARRFYMDDMYRCADCGHKFGPYLERLTQTLRNEDGKSEPGKEQ